MTLEEYNGPQLDDVTVPPRDFEGLSKEECIEAVREWFFENFEDPVHHDMYISAEGGYQYIWGGPYDASEVLSQAFEEYLPQDIIEAAIEDIQKGGTYNWTTAHRRIQPPEPEEDPIVPFKAMQKYISELEGLLSVYQERPAGIGHNKPPEPIDETPLTKVDIGNITVNINVLKSQEPYKAESKERVEQAVDELMSIGAKLGKYFSEKGAEFIDEAVKAAGSEFGKRGMQVGAVYIVFELLEKITQSALEWIKLLF